MERLTLLWVDLDVIGCILFYFSCFGQCVSHGSNIFHSMQELAHDLAAALYRLLSKRNTELRAGAMSVADALLQLSGGNGVCTEEDHRVDDEGIGVVKEEATCSETAVGDNSSAEFYRDVFKRHGVMKLVSALDSVDLRCRAGGTVWALLSGMRNPSVDILTVIFCLNR